MAMPKLAASMAFPLELAPLEFGPVVGLYIATLFVVCQVVSVVAFRATPAPPILVGGAFIVLGDCLVLDARRRDVTALRPPHWPGLGSPRSPSTESSA